MKNPICSVTIKYEQDVVHTRKRCREIADLLGFDLQDQTRITTALSELARNAFQYAGSGVVRYSFVAGNTLKSPSRYEIEVEDHGPGIGDLHKILEGHYVSRTGMGVGVIGARRLMDEFQIETGPQGTKVTIAKDLPKNCPVKTAADLPALADKLASLAPGSAFDELRQQNQSLTDVLEKLAATNKELEKKRAFQEHFVSTLTHDLRSPLTAARITAELIQRKAPPEDPVRPKLDRVIKNIDRVNDMISDLLDTSQIQAGGQLPLDLDSCDLREIAAEAIDEFEALKGDRFSLESPGTCEGIWSRRALRRVIDNLISNALKYGREEGIIRLRISMEPGRATLIVSNEGNVIAQKDLAGLFEPYHRTTSARESTVQGWGLGLALVQGISRAHGGEVEAQSSREKGTLFIVTLPIDSRPHQAAMAKQT